MEKEIFKRNSIDGIDFFQLSDIVASQLSAFFPKKNKKKLQLKYDEVFEFEKKEKKKQIILKKKSSSSSSVYSEENQENDLDFPRKKSIDQITLSFNKKEKENDFDSKSFFRSFIEKTDDNASMHETIPIFKKLESESSETTSSESNREKSFFAPRLETVLQINDLQQSKKDFDNASMHETIPILKVFEYGSNEITLSESDKGNSFFINTIGMWEVPHKNDLQQKKIYLSKL